YWEAWIVKGGKTEPEERSSLSKDWIDTFKKMGVVMPGNIASLRADDWYAWPWNKRGNGRAEGQVTFEGKAWYFELPGRPCQPLASRGDPVHWSSPEFFLQYLGFEKGARRALAGNLWYQPESKFAAPKKRELMAQLHGNTVDHSLSVKWNEAVDNKSKL